MEGFLEAMDEFDLGGAAEEGLHQAGDVAREAGAEAKAQASTPEMRQLGRGMQKAADKVGDAAADAADAVKATAQDVKYSVQQKAEDLREGYQNVKEEVKVRAEAVGESAKRAKAAPRRIGYHLRKALDAWWTGVTTTLAMMAAMFVLGIVTLVVLTIALVVGLNQLLGDPAGTWVVVAIYVVAMLVAWATMRAMRAKSRDETQRRIEYSKQEVRHVTAPVRSAFSGRGRTGF